MGEALAAVILLLVVVVVGVGALVYARRSDVQRRALNRAPAVLLPPGESPDVLLANATKTYGLLQRAVRVLDKLDRSDTTRIDRATLKEIADILDQFYK